MIGKNSKKLGFTLIELLVIISIVGFIVSAGILAFTTAKDKARMTKGLNFNQSLNNSLGSEAVGTWNLDEGTGATILDSSGNNRNGHVYGATYINNTISGEGYALNFTGTEYVGEFYDDFDMGMNGFTIAAFFKTDSMITYGQWIAGNKGTAYPTNSGFELILEGGKPGIFIADGLVMEKLQTPIQYADGKWHHVAATVARGKKIKLFVDGSLNSEIGEGLSGEINHSYPFSIGQRPGGGSEFIGAIDSVRIYKEAMNISQIKMLYAEGVKKYEIAKIKNID